MFLEHLRKFLKAHQVLYFIHYVTYTLFIIYYIYIFASGKIHQEPKMVKEMTEKSTN